MIVLIVLNYNDCETTTQFVNAVTNYKSIDKVIVVDNHSTDSSFERLMCLRSEKVDIIQTEENRGYATGNNYGIRYGLEKYSPEYVIISNPDVAFEESIVEKLLEHAKKIDNLGAISCNMKCLSGVNLVSAWALPTYADYLLSNFLILNKLIKSQSSYPKIEAGVNLFEVDALAGAFFMMSAKAFREVDGFDENTFLYCEESILAARLHAKGYKNYLATDMEYLHMHSVSINKNFHSVKKRLEMRQQSREVYCQKYLHTGAVGLFMLRLAFRLGLCEHMIADKIKRFLK